MAATDPRLYSAAAERNRGPILEVLQRVLPAHGSMLEIASGSGQHALHFAAGLPGWIWQPSDADASARASIAAHAAAAKLPRLLPPIALDVLQPSSATAAALGVFDAVFCANLLHIAPWAACAGLMQFASRHLRPAGRLLVYGPFIVEGIDTAPSNLAFDRDLRSRDPAWGLRRLDEVEREARGSGLQALERFAMPANNQLLVFERVA
ncbi:DUF938 domain-containing protein [Rivibacter subsaxonicus]|uniref:Uncharacterized protein DUF938 n=1 Tax=Rivibacter subsaxonicus TaxID=457575 RepID=A0A4Q7W1Z1_9BURK|nr:DUF938 domain-containing protein [Rivibacter subsaxonicus]RZU02978.1 uncharacterized protein DUF938 [Rivibacter subsaxonicus]